MELVGLGVKYAGIVRVCLGGEWGNSVCRERHSLV